jgi:hypothetical protein
MHNLMIVLHIKLIYTMIHLVHFNTNKSLKIKLINLRV